MPKFKDQSLQKMFDVALDMAVRGEFSSGGKRLTGTPLSCAFWDGYDGIDKTLNAVPGTLGWAVFQAGKEFKRREK